MTDYRIVSSKDEDDKEVFLIEEGYPMLGPFFPSWFKVAGPFKTIAETWKEVEKIKKRHAAITSRTVLMTFKI